MASTPMRLSTLCAGSVTMRPFEMLPVLMGSGMGAMVKPWHDGVFGWLGLSESALRPIHFSSYSKNNSAPIHRWKGALPVPSVNVPG